MAPRPAKPTTYRALSIAPSGANGAPILYELLGDSTEIGSAEDNAIVLAGPGVAPHHLVVRRAFGQEHLLVDLAERRRQRDPDLIRHRPGDMYWCPRHGNLTRLDRHGRCPKCPRRRGSLWLLRPLAPGDSFGIGKAFRATLVVQQRPTSEPGTIETPEFIFPPNELFETNPPKPVPAPSTQLDIPTSLLPTDDSNLWAWRPACAPFPVFLHQRVNRMVTWHARENNQREVGGILLGDVRQDPRGQMFVVITHALQAESAAESRGHLTFTHKTWLKIHQMHEAQYPDKTIVGWYHTHPGWTIFLSEWDLFIHRNFFKEPWQIALVLDPSADRAGFFVWNGDQVLDPQAPIEPFRLIELERWGNGIRPRVRIKLMDASV